MYTNLILYRNELKNKNIAKYKIVGIVTELIYSRVIFKKNKDIEEFVKEVFSIECKSYIIKSRGMIASKVVKFIINSESNVEYKNKLINFINLQIEIIKESKDIKDKKNEFDGWIRNE